MKVCYLCHSDNYHIKNWAKALAKRGHELHLITFRPFQYEQSNIKIHFLQPIFQRIYYFDFIAAAPRVRSLIRSINPDVTIASFANTYGLTASLAQVKPLIIQTWSRDIAAPASVNKREKIMAHTIGKYVLEHSDAITTDSLNFAELISKRWPQLTQKILPTPWGIDVNKYTFTTQQRQNYRSELGIASEDIVLTSIRGVYWYYNPKLVLSALEKVYKQWEGPTLHINVLTLDQPRTAEIDTYLNDLQQYKFVMVFDTYLEWESLRKIWGTTDYFISTPKFDGVSEALQEGRMAGTIPILNDIPANREVAIKDKHAFYVDTQNAERMAQDILSILKTSMSKRKEMIKNNQEWVREHANVNKTLDNLIDLMQSLV